MYNLFMYMVMTMKSYDFLCHGNIIQNIEGPGQEVFQRTRLPHTVVDSLDTSLWRCRYLCRKTMIRIFKSPALPLPLNGCETWTLARDLEQRTDAFVIKCPCSIMGYRFFDRLSNQRFLHETKSKPIACIVLNTNSS